jgi:hypothetical protein
MPLDVSRCCPSGKSSSPPSDTTFALVNVYIVCLSGGFC